MKLLKTTPFEVAGIALKNRALGFPGSFFLLGNLFFVVSKIGFPKKTSVSMSTQVVLSESSQVPQAHCGNVPTWCWMGNCGFSKKANCNLKSLVVRKSSPNWHTKNSYKAPSIQLFIHHSFKMSIRFAYVLRIMKPLEMVFLFKDVIFSFHVYLPGCKQIIHIPWLILKGCGIGGCLQN